MGGGTQVADFSKGKPRKSPPLSGPKCSLAQGFSLNGPCQSGGYTSCRCLVVKNKLFFPKICGLNRNLNARKGYYKLTVIHNVLSTCHFRNHSKTRQREAAGTEPKAWTEEPILFLTRLRLPGESSVWEKGFMRGKQPEQPEQPKSRTRVSPATPRTKTSYPDFAGGPKRGGPHESPQNSIFNDVFDTEIALFGRGAFSRL